MKKIDVASLGLTDLSANELEAVNGGSVFGSIPPIYVPSPTFPEPIGFPDGPSYPFPIDRPTIGPIIL
jgi:hypothetical protein